MALALLPRYDGRLGDALVGMGVLRPVELFRAVADQVRERYLEIFRWREGRWAFRRGVACEEETYPLGQSAHELLRDAALRADPAEMEAALSGMREKVVMTTSRPPIALREFGMPDRWVQLLAEARGDSTLGGISGARHPPRGGSRRGLSRVLFGPQLRSRQRGLSKRGSPSHDLQGRRRHAPTCRGGVSTPCA